MIFRITGYILILLGLWWIYRPERLQRKFTRKINRSTFVLLFMLLVYIAGLLWTAIKNSYGITAKLLFIIILIVFIKIITMLNKKSRAYTLEILKKAPAGFWRTVSAIQILAGILLQFIK